MFGFCNMIEGGRKKLLTQLLTSDYKYPGITYTQSGNLTYFDSSGVLQTAAVDTMVLDYNPATLALRGYPYWEARTNVVLWNRDLTNAAWTKTNTTAAKTATGIDGTANSASTLTATGANGTCLQAITLGSSARFQTCYIKRRTGSGTINMTMDNGTTWTAVTVTASWTQVSIPTQTLANPTVGFRIVTSGDAVDIDYAQNENGTFATAVIATTTAAVTRAAPSCACTGSNFSSWYNQTEGTIVVQAMPADTSSNQARAFGISDGTTNNFIDISRIGTSAQIRAQVVAGGVGQFNNITDSWPISTLYKAANAYKAANFAAALNGGTVVTKASGTIPTVDRMTIGSLNAGNYFNGWIQSLANYGARVPDASVKALST